LNDLARLEERYRDVLSYSSALTLLGGFAVKVFGSEDMSFFNPYCEPDSSAGLGDCFGWAGTLFFIWILGVEVRRTEERKGKG
jgi:hypothetical protein